MTSAKARDNDLKGAFAHHKNSAMRRKIIYFDFLCGKYFFFITKKEKRKAEVILLNRDCCKSPWKTKFHEVKSSACTNKVYTV